MTDTTTVTARHELARSSLRLWSIYEPATVRLLNVSENTTFLIETENDKAVLRVHRTGYHSRQAIESELAWLDALNADGSLRAPIARRGRDGNILQSAWADGNSEPLSLVLFDFIDGAAPDEGSNLAPGFQVLGEFAARLHTHVERWEKPNFFKRFTWDTETIFGPNPTWGHWRNGPGVTSENETLFAHAEAAIRRRLANFGKANDRFNLIHADMRLANLLVGTSETRLIDFDDCGFGWFLYDFAAAISFIEDDPRVPDLKAAWLEGYRRTRPLSAEKEAEIDTFVMLRRMALLAWIGSHIDAPEPQALAPHFAARTADLAEAWLTRN